MLPQSRSTSLFVLLLAVFLQPSFGFVSERKLDVAVHPNLVLFRKDCIPNNANHNHFPQLLSQQQQAEAAAEDDKTRKQTALLNSGVGGLVLAGGIAGFLRKGSKASLMAGSTFGGLLLGSAALIWTQKGSTSGYKLAGIVSFLLAVVMGKKYFSSGVYMPAGLIATLGAITFVYNSVDSLVVGSTESGAAAPDATAEEES